VVIDYKAGAAGNIASEYVARAKPDGYTLVFGTAATHGSNAALYKKLPFDVENDFVPVAPVLDVSNVLTINPEVINVRTLKEFVELVKAHPASTTSPPPAMAQAPTWPLPSSTRASAWTWSTCPTRAAPRPSRRCCAARPAAS
jgi:tripartite-type tricarboxylate transporter receptor subunit TctC